MTNNNKRWITRHKFWEKKRELRDINRIASLNCEIKMQLSLYLFNFIVFYFSRWKQISLVHMYIFHLNLNYCFISYIYKGVNIKHFIKHSAWNALDIAMFSTRGAVLGAEMCYLFWSLMYLYIIGLCWLISPQY